MPASKAHWEEVYAGRAADEMSWYQEDPAHSRALIAGTGISFDAPIIDVGGGASRLVDALLWAGFINLTVLDISGSALRRAQHRLGSPASTLDWIEGDVLTCRVGGPYVLWHDRAVFHFLTDPADRARYIEVLAGAVAPDGFIVMATFGADGPEVCSGLPVARYDAEGLTEALAPVADPIGFEEEMHVTPDGRSQPFQYGVFRRTG